MKQRGLSRSLCRALFGILPFCFLPVNLDGCGLSDRHNVSKLAGYVLRAGYAPVDDANQLHGMHEIYRKGEHLSASIGCSGDVGLPLLDCDLNGKLTNLPALVRSSLEQNGDETKKPSNARSDSGTDNSSEGSVHSVVSALVGYVVGSAVAFAVLIWFYFLPNITISSAI